MNRKLLSLITILCIFTVSLLGQVAYASELNSTNVVDQVTANGTEGKTVTWTKISGATQYHLTCRDITYGADGPYLYDDYWVGDGDTREFTFLDYELESGHRYKVYIAGYNADGKYVGSRTQSFLY